MRDRVVAEAIDPAYKSQSALDGYEAVLRETLAPVFARISQIDPGLQMATNAEVLARLNTLIKRGDETGETNRLREVGITEKAIVEMAQRIAGETKDLGQAWLELQNAMDIAVRVQEEGRVTSNHGDFVDEVLRRVADLAKEGDYASAGDQIDAALAEEDAAHTARKVRLLDSGAEVALLAGDTARAADLLVRKADHEAGGEAEFEVLRALQDAYFVEGRDKALNFKSELAIDLARIVLGRAKDADERGTAGNDLGIALRILGQRESGTAHLEAAVAAYETALEERIRDRVPMDWAMTQMNLGIALRALGERESGTERLEAAVASYEAALEERTRDRAPMKWATTQMNLGNVLVALARRESGTERLEAAVAAFEAALEEHARDRVPLQWAMTQMNLGGTLVAFARRESGTERLEAAVAAYEAALEECTRDRVPLQWSMTQHGLSGVELAFFDKTGDATHLDRAKKHAEAAKEFYVEVKADHYIDWIDGRIAEIQSRRPSQG